MLGFILTLIYFLLPIAMAVHFENGIVSYKMKYGCYPCEEGVNVMIMKEDALE
jgi:hypothetical protein